MTKIHIQPRLNWIIFRSNVKWELPNSSLLVFTHFYKSNIKIFTQSLPHALGAQVCF